MKILAINSSPRSGGRSKTELMLNHLVEGMQEAGADVEVVNLREKNIKNCIGCFTCWTKTPGKCLHKDDMTNELFPKWLEADLEVTEKNTVVFVHQRLDDENNSHGVKNAQEVRKILEQSGKVLAVFQGHDHRGAYSDVNKIHYCTLPALVDGTGLENNAYAIVQIRGDGSIEIDGFGKLKDLAITQQEGNTH